tara:strand:- start:2056 stop:2268 length:213 start_codon:yes stop_codon:yes gene_type:complete
MIFFTTEEELVKKLREEDTCEEEQHCSDEWIVNNAFELGWVSNFENSLDGFLYFENDEESDEWFNKQELI